MTDGSDRSAAPADGPGGNDLCAHCGESIDTSEWHPVVARTENGEFELYPFCDEDCRDDWEASER